MQEKFRMLLAAKQDKPKIKIKSLDDLNKEVAAAEGEVILNKVSESEDVMECADSAPEHAQPPEPNRQIETIEPDLDRVKTEVEEPFEMSIDVAVEEVGDSCDDIMIDETSTQVAAERRGHAAREIRPAVNGDATLKNVRRKSSVEEETEAGDTSDSDRLVIQDEEKPNISLLHSLLMKV